MSQDPDAALVLASRAGDRQAFEQLLARHERAVFNAAYRILHHRDDAADVTQTAFLRAYEHLDRYDPAMRFFSWIYRIAINEATKNPVLVKTYNSVNARVTSLRFRTNQNAARWKIAVKEHERMVEALTAHDATALREVLVEHLTNKRDTVIELLRAGEVYPQPAIPLSSTR